MRNTLCWLVLSLVLILGLAGCQQPVESLPDIPGTHAAPNPDFLTGSNWANEDTADNFHEFHIKPFSRVEAVITDGRSGSIMSQIESLIPGLQSGTLVLKLLTPGPGQKLASHYPETIPGAYAVLFTDDAVNPTAAEIALLLPTSRAAFGEPVYLVLLGNYVKGLDTMDWELFSPVHRNGAVVLKPSGLPALVFRRK